MTSLPARSWYSLSEGFEPPESLASSVPGRTLVFADAGDVSAIPSVLESAAVAGRPVAVGVELMLEHEGLIRRATVLARGEEGVPALLEAAATARHPADPSRPPGQPLPGATPNLPVISIGSLRGPLLVVSGGGGSLFEDCRARGDARGFLSFVDALRQSGIGASAGYDPGLSDPRDAAFIRALRSHPKPVPVLPWRWTTHGPGQSDLYHASARSVFGQSVPPDQLRVGTEHGTMESLAAGTPLLDGSDLAAFSRVVSFTPAPSARPAPGEFLFRDPSGAVLTPEQSSAELRKRSLANLEKMMAASGVKGPRAEARRRVYLARIDRELDAIAASGTAGRILQVSDLMAHCRKLGIKCMARGSSANSLVCYLNRISLVNPVTFNLPPERFINTRRNSLPDIDVDVAASRAPEVRNFLCSTGGGGVLLRSTVEAGFVDVLQRELRAAGVPYAHDLRDRLRTSMGVRRVPNSYAELEAEYAKYARRADPPAPPSLPEFIASRLSSANPETVLAAVRTARALEGRPRHHVDHAGVAMRPVTPPPLSPTLRSATGLPVLAASHSSAEGMGFAKIDILPRAALDMVERVQRAVEASGGKVRPVSSVFTATRRPLDLLRRGLVGGLDQLGPSSRSEIPHGRLLSSWQEELTNHDLVNYLALVRYGTGGWTRANRPEGELRPRMLALYLGSMSASPVLEDLGRALAARAEADLKSGGKMAPWLSLASRGESPDQEPSAAASPAPRKMPWPDLRAALVALPARLAALESVEGPEAGAKILARLTHGPSTDKRAHMQECASAIAAARKGNPVPAVSLLAGAYGLPPENPAVVRAAELLSSGKAIQRPEHVASLGQPGIETWDRVTASTRGLLLFQEQVTDLLVGLSGCDYATCDLVRDSVAHRDRPLPPDVSKAIIEGISKTASCPPERAERFMSELTETAPYLFNKGHAAVYAGLITWQLENKKQWPASFALGCIEHLRASGAKASDAAPMLGSVLCDAVALGCTVDASGLPLRARTEVREKPGQPGTILLGLDAFLPVGADTVARWPSLALALSKFMERGATAADDLAVAPFSLPPEEAELVHGLKQGGARAAGIAYRNLGMIPPSMVPTPPPPDQCVPADSLNFYSPSCPKVANAWGFVLSPPQVSKGQGRRPCRVSFSFGTAASPNPIEVSYLFWPERGKDAGPAFLPKEAVDLQARLSTMHAQLTPFSTVLRLNEGFGRWDGSFTTIKTHSSAPPASPSPKNPKVPEATARQVQDPVRKVAHQAPERNLPHSPSARPATSSPPPGTRPRPTPATASRNQRPSPAASAATAAPVPARPGSSTARSRDRR